MNKRHEQCTAGILYCSSNMTETQLLISCSIVQIGTMNFVSDCGFTSCQLLFACFCFLLYIIFVLTCSYVIWVLYCAIQTFTLRIHLVPVSVCLFLFLFVHDLCPYLFVCPLGDVVLCHPVLYFLLSWKTTEIVLVSCSWIIIFGWSLLTSAEPFRSRDFIDSIILTATHNANITLAVAIYYIHCPPSNRHWVAIVCIVHMYTKVQQLPMDYGYALILHV
jgi:hypothetical protein